MSLDVCLFSPVLSLQRVLLHLKWHFTDIKPNSQPLCPLSRHLPLPFDLKVYCIHLGQV